MKTGLIIDLGITEYGAAWALQRRVVAARKAGAVPDMLLLCEHPHVITLAVAENSRICAPRIMCCGR